MAMLVSGQIPNKLWETKMDSFNVSDFLKDVGQKQC